MINLNLCRAPFPPLPQRGKFDENRKLPNGKMLEFAKVRSRA